MADEERTEMTSEGDDEIFGMQLHGPESMSFTGRNPHFVWSLGGILPDKVWLSLKAAGSEVAKVDGLLLLAGLRFDFPSAGSLDYTHATPLLFEGFRSGYPRERLRRECWAGKPVRITEPLSLQSVMNPLRVKGEGAPGAKIRIVRSDNLNVVLSDFVDVSSLGTWEVELNQYIPQTPGNGIIAQMSFGTYPPVYSERVVLWVSGLVFTSPTSNEVVRSDKIVFKGRTSSLFTFPVTVVNQKDLNEVVSVVAEPDQETKLWEAAAKETPRLPSGVITVRSRYLLGGSYTFSDPLTFRVLGTPVIAAPASGSQQNQTFTLSGNQGLLGAKVEIFKDLGTTKVGESGVLTSANWTAQVTVDPGNQSLVALQNHSGKQSQRGAPRGFNIRPPQLPPITVTYPNETTVRLSGTAYNAVGADTKVHIHYRQPSAPTLPDVDASSGSWTRDIMGLLPRNSPYTFDAQQSVTDGIGGRIKNASWTTAVVTMITPEPILNTPTLSGQIPTFTGRGNVWTGQAAARIEVRLNGSTHALLGQANVAAGGTWTVRATAKLAPGTYVVTVFQLMNNVWSTAATAPNLIIKPDPSLVTKPGSAPVELTTEFNGTTWPNADVVVRYKDGAQIHAFKSNATTGYWGFNATLKSPGSITVQVEATFGGQASTWKDHTFTVKTPVPGITYPQNNNEVGFKLIVRGTNAFPGSTIKVFDATSSNKVLGQTTVSTTGAWAVELDKEFEKEGQQVIYVVQQFGTYPSEPSAAIVFNVKVGLPVITTPAANARFARSSEVVGTGIPGASVTLKIGNTVIASDIPVGANGQWRRTVNLPTVGSTTMVAEQSYRGGMRPSINRVFTVVPNAPVIESPSGGEFVTPAWVVASGAGYPGDTVSVTRDGYTEVIGSFVVDPQGYWSGKLTHVLGGADPYLYRALSTFNAVVSDWSVASVTLLAAGPTLYEPAAGDWVGAQPFYRGLATPGAAITVASCFNPAQVLASTTADAYGRWEIQSSQTLPEGACRVVVQQISGGVVSERVESGRFMVEKLPRDFTAPTIDYPKPGDRVGRKPVMSGSGVPGAYVQIFKAGVLTELAGGFVDREGRWTASFTAALPVGAFTCSVRQLRDDVSSALRLSNQALTVVQVPANFPGPVIIGPQMNEQVEVQPLISGTGMPGARIDVHKHNNLTQVEASAIVDAQGMWSVRLPVLTVGPHQIVARQFIDGQLSVFFGPINVTVTNTIRPLVILSPQSNAQVPPRPLIRGIALPGATVNLRKDGDGNTGYGTGVADAQGHWAIVVTRTLPIGQFVITGNVTKAGTPSDWMPVPVRLRVVNAG
ncbi:hypothetical protein [Pseudomonas sp. ACM7]|uniref:hypothetical protein n=1 Tax=Pseudomonas sp. ACM7 TaxID=2052956 RepID=UPI0010112733|nr:hypothetical protein [Pseudomonas sp. ACM7]QAY89509.1 hypothetical protein CUN63_06000 [Pseudomonas sp. ACM7]